MPVAKGLPLGLSQNEVNDGLDELSGFLRHHLPGSGICVGPWYDDKGVSPHSQMYQMGQLFFQVDHRDCFANFECN